MKIKPRKIYNEYKDASKKEIWGGVRIGTAAMVTKKGNSKEYFKDIALKIVKVIK